MTEASPNITEHLTYKPLLYTESTQESILTSHTQYTHIIEQDPGIGQGTMVLHLDIGGSFNREWQKAPKTKSQDPGIEGSVLTHLHD